ncbi:hypothetical protein [Streptomyces naphthomycinicus]|uniref:hypothetical protein n=1 Tax=Streptomyces naphthomycinicus TaxID=2872625 RepID=UPI001CECE13D|nr:hypothetical protein [Streptomyces sp. TML10]
MRLRTMSVAGSFATAAAAMLFAAGPASAGTDVYVDTTDPWNAAAAGFASDGEVFTVCDNRSDGLRAGGHIGWTDSSASHWVPLEDTNGAGNSCARKDLSIGEGIKVTVEICVKDGADGDPKYCATKSGKA